MRLAGAIACTSREVFERGSWKKRESYAIAGAPLPVDRRDRGAQGNIEIALTRECVRRARGVHQGNRATAKFRHGAANPVRDLADWIATARDIDSRESQRARPAGRYRDIEKVLAYVDSGYWMVCADGVLADACCGYSSRYSRRPPMTFFT